MDHFDSAGLRIAYLDAAPSPEIASPVGADTVVLVHGFASNHRVNWVNPGWIKTMTDAGYRVLALDNRGHGQSDKPHEPAAYATPLMADDVARLLDHRGIEQADVMGYSMGARITAFLALGHPHRVRSIILGGLGHHLVDGASLPPHIADAMEVASLDDLTDPTQRMFRRFADQNGNDRIALAACIRGTRQVLSAAELGTIGCPALVAVGSTDHIAGDPHTLAALLPAGEALVIPDRDHNFAVGDKVYKRGALAFLAARS
ncbi:alpha/beta fold hydrolase [Lichenihabitans psoromatis]|uniref:alpha/beta fold hydrolase n=1 Tax=Lichenihabitans psoromatis TaxID=2528642 RepID=UPI0010383FE4|nr:alpha/beta hydrolase [Lichenihabitans psoromatis]